VQEAQSAGQDPEGKKSKKKSHKNTARIEKLQASLNEVMGCMNPAVSA